MRINKYIQSSGFCSRRKAEEYINASQVTVNGEIATLQTVIEENDEVRVNNILIKPKKEHVVLLFNKPVGITCTTEHHIEGNIIDFINYPERIFPIGRLDKDSCGLILLTSDGDLVNECLRVENGHEKEYVVEVDRKITPEFIHHLESGVKIYNPVSNSYVITNPCTVKQIANTKFSIILKQGYNRQIRRMCTAYHYHVRSLKRIRFMHLQLDVPVGKYRLLSQEDINKLKGIADK